MSDRLPAITLHQPWASLLFTQRSCQTCIDHGPPLAAPHCDGCPTLKQWETRSRRVPRTIVGKRVLIHAAARQPVNVHDAGMVADRSIEGNWSLVTGDDMRPVCAMPLGAIIGSVVIGESVPIVRSTECLGWATHHACVHPNVGVVEHRAGVDGSDPGTDDTEVDISNQMPFGDWAPGRWAWPISAPVLFDRPIPYKGMQGVFYVEPGVVR